MIGAAANPEGFTRVEVEGSGEAEIAAEIDRLRERLAGEPEHIVVASSDEPASRCPRPGGRRARATRSCSWSATQLPEATVEALRRHDGVPVYVLGPESAISAKTIEAIEVRPGRSGSAPRARSRTRSTSPATSTAASAGTSTTRVTGS